MSMTQEEYVQIIHNLDNSFKDNFNIHWHDGKGGKSQPIRGFTATHKHNPNVKRVVDKEYVNNLQKQVQISTLSKQHRKKSTSLVSPERATLLRLKFDDRLKYIEQADGKVLVVWSY